MATGMFGEVLNLQTFLEYLIQKPIKVIFHQDNDAVLKIRKNRYSAKLRHMNRVHKVNIASLCEVLEDGDVVATYCPSAEQRANGFTKIIPPGDWIATITQMCLNEQSVRIWDLCSIILKLCVGNPEPEYLEWTTMMPCMYSVRGELKKMD